MRTEEEIQEKLINQVLGFLSFRFRSEKEIRDYILKKITHNPSINPELQIKLPEKIITYLKKLNFVDDKNFAKVWTENQLRVRAKSLPLIRIGLMKKGVDKEIIEKITKDINPEVEVEQVKALVRKKLRILKSLSIQEKKQKILSFLSRRGFNWDLSRRVVDTLVEKD